MVLRVQICLAETCRAQGAARLARTAEALLGIAMGSADGAVALEEVQCTGLCKGAPCVVVNGRTHVRVDVRRLGELLDKGG